MPKPFDTKLKKQFRHHSKVIQPIKVCVFHSMDFICNIDRLIFLGDYRKWEAAKTEPIRHDGGYVRIISTDNS